MTAALLKDLLTIGAAAVERQPGRGDRPFWLWDVDVALVHENPEWDPTNWLGSPRYFFGKGPDPEKMVKLSAENMFLLRHETSTYERISISPVKTAIYYVECWLGVGDYQHISTSKATKNTILQMIDATEDELAAFREYWNHQIEGEGETPIINKKVESTTLNAKNDDELYLAYEKKMLQLVALAFDLNSRDYNLEIPDNRATAGVAADASFQDAILPYAQTTEEHLNIDVVDFYEPGFTCKLSDTEPRGEEAEAATAIQIFQGGLSRRNESRARIGLPAIEGEAGEAFADGKSAEETEAGEKPEPQKPEDSLEDPGDKDDEKPKPPTPKRRKRVRT